MAEDVIDRIGLVSDQVSKDEVRIILRELARTLSVPGDVVELGCYVGTTSLYLQRALLGGGKTLHVYDSFAGLPQKSSYDASPSGEQFKPGELAATKATFIAHFKRANLPLPIIHKAWFGDLTAADMPARICFAYLDGDFYESIMDSLRVIWPQLQPGAVIVIDDYHNLALPGAQRAVDDWLRTHPARLQVQASLAIIQPKV